jgi:hypothetical protein
MECRWLSVRQSKCELSSLPFHDKLRVVRRWKLALWIVGGLGVTGERDGGFGRSVREALESWRAWAAIAAGGTISRSRSKTSTALASFFYLSI